MDQSEDSYEYDSIRILCGEVSQIVKKQLLDASSRTEVASIRLLFDEADRPRLEVVPVEGSRLCRFMKTERIEVTPETIAYRLATRTQMPADQALAMWVLLAWALRARLVTLPGLTLREDLSFWLPERAVGD